MAKIIEIIDQNEALVDIDGVRKQITISLLPDLKVGDWTLVHTGFAISKIDEEKAKEILDSYELMKNIPGK